MKVLIIDNYDSFTYTIAFYLKELNIKYKIIKNDQFKHPKKLKKYNFTHLLISPGPNSPKESKLSLKTIKYFKKNKKILGICLGHQCIAYAFGGKISKLPNPTHGKIKTIEFIPNPLFLNLNNNFKICLYHSLYVSYTGKKCKTLATDENGIIMAIKHKKYDIYGIQFHPEAILSQNGKEILKNFLSI
ncbi:para-aminobenzoate synthase component II, glutamine amidotransferase [Campylobacter insulaenigrae]|uniref:anthranilate synthase component II n=1 Tax=Campylobacter insulaenigrae TaxID=260714 RepID=UPI000F6B6E58|nr:aminodeoxychorismate/anthranilate synthase component II [Campylobacter insulaenigrae]MCR6590866.1 aminodeoxychorismate/anthranilate synthase component II [Campylobacter insulaenigrae]MCR6592543.1 aminodeoxychorismate/anthranilate synthase component II [Campylobacter insulaenigrae]VEJ54089.1 para-aminobenzoate synthase component II, glutamine amidotransferase [Campylobacter insulaenigrae]